ncbi:MAG: UPF0280 family protein [Deltaproteobacteria bacterium]|nr:UPF0280 family protein [Deltaproteobacteria bacterium]MBW1719097.1 UPF0280 family protein [Deltaproteobacteria bacterium]MBW1932151.1 UPF0280 family protein [Deltaproteobacteria bacterium]MBW1939182.1 UPF0280 family protein [Deltaproteobacteria bacterium]MBW2079884.1 UPF0280 family protein [Deltaproteobacteria bacterium]
MGEKRRYRSFIARNGLTGFQVRHQETDLHIQSDRNLENEASTWVIEVRLSIEGYARSHPGFLESYIPLPDDPFAPAVVRDMLESSAAAGVGPMAAVAGAIAQHVGKRCVEFTSGEVIVENGGDIFLWVLEPIISAIWAGSSPLSGRIGIAVAPSQMSLGICTSSGTVGHSRSLGKADAVTIVSQSVSLADATATSMGNMIRTERDINPGLNALKKIPGILGGVIIKGTKLGIWGQIELVPLNL